jgi:alpha/beta superfamily hydrolase
MWFLTAFNSQRYLNKLKEATIPTLLIFGQCDNFTSLSSYQSLSKYFQFTISVPGVDHFWRGKELLLIEKIESFLTSNE